MLHLPILRQGEPYKSLDVVRVPHHRTREPFVEISQANPGLIRRDLRPERQAGGAAALARIPFDRLIAMCAEAADVFLNDTLPLGDVAAVAGRLRAAAVGDDRHAARAGAPEHAAGRRRDAGDADRAARPDARPRHVDARRRASASTAAMRSASIRATDALGVVLPSNSPGVHSLWIPAIALKIPLVLKPGSAEPWTPFRIAQAFMKVGCPPETFSYYPADHAGAGEVLRRTGRSMFFGDVAAVGGWEGDPRVELHGPGYSKILIGDDLLAGDEWEKYVDLMAASIAENGGRSCVNASGIWVAASHAERVARRRSPPGSRRSCRAPRMTSGRRWRRLRIRASRSGSRRRSTAACRTTVRARSRSTTGRRPRLATLDGCTYLQPTLVALRCARSPAGEPRVPVSVRRRRQGRRRSRCSGCRSRWARRSS